MYVCTHTFKISKLAVKAQVILNLIGSTSED